MRFCKSLLPSFGSICLTDKSSLIDACIILIGFQAQLSVISMEMVWMTSAPLLAYTVFNIVMPGPLSVHRNIKIYPFQRQNQEGKPQARRH